jgi:hypothetical protein
MDSQDNRSALEMAVDCMIGVMPAWLPNDIRLLILDIAEAGKSNDVERLNQIHKSYIADRPPDTYSLEREAGRNDSDITRRFAAIADEEYEPEDIDDDIDFIDADITALSDLVKEAYTGR